MGFKSDLHATVVVGAMLFGFHTVASASAQPSDWLEQLGRAVVADGEFQRCLGDDAPCGPDSQHWVTSLTDATGSVACTGVGGPPPVGGFACAILGATFTLPPRPPSTGFWSANYITQSRDDWVLGTAELMPPIAQGYALADNTKLVVSHTSGSGPDGVRLECGSIDGGLVCADHLTGTGFHASRDNFTPFTFTGTVP